MKRNRAIFKLALRYCRNHIEEMKADACAESLLNKDARKFWDNVYKISIAKTSAQVNSIGGVTGSVDVTSMWKDYFEKLYNSKQDSEFRTRFMEKLQARNVNFNTVFTIYDVLHAVRKQKKVKLQGPMV